MLFFRHFTLESSPNTVLPGHGAAKKLPPGIIRQIFSNLKGPGETLDLLACSLICTSWFDESLQLVSDKLQSLYFGDHFDVEEIIRLAELLVKSHRLRLPHCELITQLSIPSAVLIDRPHHVSELGTFRDKAAEAYLTILRRTPNLRRLRVTTYCWLTRDYQKPYIDNHNATGQLLLFFDSAMSLCNTITGLVFYCDDKFSYDAFPLHLFIPKVVYSVAAHLESLETRNF
ncbi:hypothetical protein BC938DRAFT_481378 [Jimgerdemannia flammicorona]|uniref:F-box domain-containing protein n=1 Tax=Jimgerdemannia flammicorona TaxID=994334 RepID=A0A433QGI6_9FUNG|nr:hypothetical protein BC938DRAFT_481378 [Jimgerdemannia flammicorona]